jgi:uncharacterized protein
MKLIENVRRSRLPWLVLTCLFLGELASAQSSPQAQYPAFPSETPAKVELTNYGFDYVRHDVMIPMRDGVKLHTVIVVPKGARHAPILLTRTPYNATEMTSHAQSAHLGPILNGDDEPTEVAVEDGYIRVVQDVRGKYTRLLPFLRRPR